MVKINKRNLKDKIIRKLVSKYEIIRLLYKYNIITSINDNDVDDENKNNNIELKLNNTNNLNLLSKNSSKVRVKNRCILSGRGRAIYKDFRLSRHMFRKLALEGYLPGVKKSSW